MKAINRGKGVTESERYLASLADKTFLDLWSYPNTFNDNRGHKTGDGKEICDLLVVFGDDVLIFSDKAIEWKEHPDPIVSWKRWYKRAVQKSVSQIRGADRWLREHPDRVFIDQACLHPLPLELPSAERRRVHGIAVALGAEQAGKEYFGGKDGSFVIAPEIKGEAHAPVDSTLCQPFFIGDVDPDGPFVHVFDQRGLDLVMTELDTVSDFVRYLNLRSEAIRSGKIILASNEADLLAFYLQNEDEHGKHVFSVKDEAPDTAYVIEEGLYDQLQLRSEYVAKKEADRISSAWDKLIGLFTKTVLEGTAISRPGMEATVGNVEQALRIMAAEDRTRRRLLSEVFIGALESSSKTPNLRFSRGVLPVSDAADPLCAYVFVFLPFPSDVKLERGYEQYREVRGNILATYAYAILRRNKHLKRAIAIAMESVGGSEKEHGGSEDLAMLEVHEWTEKLTEEVKEHERLYDVMREGRVRYSDVSTQEYPDVSGGNIHGTGSEHVGEVRMTRQQKRAAERRAKKNSQN